MKKALITGISGQDGSYLARYLLSKGYKVYGTSRCVNSNDFFRLRALNIYDRVDLLTMTTSSFRDVFEVINRVMPDEIYNLAGQSSVGKSFKYPMECERSIVGSVINLLESIRKINPMIKLYNAASSEMFGDTKSTIANESSRFKPISPYGVSKVSSFMHVKSYRDAYGLFACSGILGNHDSALRGDEFVTKKIVQSAKDIRQGIKKRIKLGNLNTKRDWGYAVEYVEAMHLMLLNNEPDDFVICTGVSHSLKEFAKEIFRVNGLNLFEYLEVDQSLFRPNDINVTRLDPSKAKKILGWSASVNMRQLAKIMTNGEILKNGK
jgi:GDPmannose 4,6-dehydratase